MNRTAILYDYHNDNNYNYAKTMMTKILPFQICNNFANNQLTVSMVIYKYASMLVFLAFELIIKT